MKAEQKIKLAYAIEIKESYENAVKEERDLMNVISENEKKLTKMKEESEERKKRIKDKRQKNVGLKVNLAKNEADIVIKDAVYEEQLATVEKVKNLQKRHSQKAKELDALQTAFVDLEEKKDELQMQLMNKTQEVCVYFFFTLLKVEF
jgi:hypothetical protein